MLSHEKPERLTAVGPGTPMGNLRSARSPSTDRRARLALEVGQVDKEDVDRWLRAYVEAWKSYDRDQIGELFALDVHYRYHPHDDPVVGRAAVVQSWLGEASHAGASSRDEQGTYDAAYRAVAVDGDVAVATGSSSYRSRPGGPVEKVYDNCFVMRFDAEGRCREFTEWYMQRPGG